ncbi:MAG: polysaccharide biosynthesis protein [Edaphobacter sp.]|nr:polysaccharide biosynthesis protein [Edaphobacter sp.]
MKLVGKKWCMSSRDTQGLRMSDTRRRSWANAFYGGADYLVLPVGMLLTAPFLLRHLGTAQYGVWVLAGAAVSSGGIVSGSFGDAVIKYVGACRGRGDRPGIVRIVRNIISINLMLSGSLAIALWCLAPYATNHIVKVDRELQTICLHSLRIGSGLLLVRSIDGVFISTLRAFETYSLTAPISICSRVAILVFAVLLARYGRNVAWIMVATLLISTFGTLAQGLALRTKIGTFLPMPSWQRRTVSDIAAFGTFSWLQAISGVVFSHVDRFFVGVFMGAPAVAYYGLCIQAAQPIHGLISSGLHFLFPHLSARLPVAPLSEIRRKVTMAFIINAALVIALALPLIIFEGRILTDWIGSAFGQEALRIFPTIVCGFALLGMNITAHYALLAIGQIRTVTCLNLLAGIAMLLTMALLIPRYGLQGAALARLVYGPITWLTYLYLYRFIWRGESGGSLPQSSTYSVATTSANSPTKRHRLRIGKRAGVTRYISS